tara:strand:- start:34 stop:624 length:591 start_codon:yes stop_codon:yes gene_type:complete
MKKTQRRIQLFLILIGLLLFVITYFYYPNLYRNKILEKQYLKKEPEKTRDENQATTFKNIEYKGIYYVDKPFTVKSENAYILNKEPDIVYMNNMHVVLYLSDGKIVNIISDKGRYNKTTYDCFFEQNVKATDGSTEILAENLDLVATKNFAEIYNNVNLDYITGSLQADKISYDFETKYFKVSMFSDKTVKMKVIR